MLSTPPAMATSASPRAIIARPSLFSSLGPGAAESVHGDGRHLLGQPREQERHARHVAVVLAGLVREPNQTSSISPGRNARARDRLGDHERRQIVRPLARERAAVAPDRRAHGRDEDDAARLTAADAIRRTRREPGCVVGAERLGAAEQLAPPPARPSSP